MKVKVMIDPQRRDEICRYLHWPAREVEDIENHLRDARTLSRALYHLVNAIEIKDERDHEAAIQLAGEVAHQCSAAQVAWYLDIEEEQARDFARLKRLRNGAGADD